MRTKKVTLREKLQLTHGLDAPTIRTKILLGAITVNGTKVTNASLKVSASDEISIHDKQKTYVSRGAIKLLKATSDFNLSFQDKVILDIGASTGGFTEVALLKGAKTVYAVDVGTNQLAYKLRTDRRVHVMEKTNLKTLTPAMFAEKLDIAVCDVSFISLHHVFVVLSALGSSGPSLLVALIKPQYEAPRDLVMPGGYVDVSEHEAIINNVIASAARYGFTLQAKTVSPIRGHNAKNIEYLALFSSEQHG